MHIVAYSASKVMMMRSYKATGNEHEEGEEVHISAQHGLKNVYEETLYCVRAQLGYFVRHRLGGGHADSTYETPLTIKYSR